MYIIGYSWCPHFQSVCRQYPRATTIVSDQDPDRPWIQTQVMRVIGKRQPIDLDTLDFTSPTIVCYVRDMAVCINGESAMPDNFNCFLNERVLKDKVPIYHTHY